jgi:hypothetical protein
MGKRRALVAGWRKGVTDVSKNDFGQRNQRLSRTRKPCSLFALSWQELAMLEAGRVDPMVPVAYHPSRGSGFVIDT